MFSSANAIPQMIKATYVARQQQQYDDERPRNFGEALPEGASCGTGSNRNGSNNNSDFYSGPQCLLLDYPVFPPPKNDRKGV